MGRGAVRRKDQGPGVKPGPQTQKRINRELGLEARWLQCDADQPTYTAQPVKFSHDEEVRAYLADLLEGHPH